MHCLVVLPFGAETGASGRKADAIDTLLEAHRRLGIELSVIALEPEPISTSPIYRYFGIGDRTAAPLLRTARIGRARHAANRIWCKKLLEAVAKSHARKPIDVALAFSMLQSPSAFCWNLWKKTGIPYVIQEHRTAYQRAYPDRALVPKPDLDALDNAKAICALTEAHANPISRVAMRSVEILPLALPDAYFAPPCDLGGRPSTKDGKWTISAWTNWREFKRLDLVIASFVLLGRKDRDAHLVVAGPVPSRQLADVKALLAATGLEHRVEFTGPIDRHAIKRLAYSCDACLIASDHETFSIPASEALAAGRPIVVTRCGGPETFVTEGANGYAVPAGDAHAISEALLKIKQNPEQFDKARIAKNAAERFSISTLSTRLSDVYGSLGLPA